MENKDSGKLGLVACIAILTGGCIGSAIFSLSGMTMYYAGPAAIITWIVAAIILGCYGVQVAELSVRYPHSGGVYVFPAKSLGKFWGYLAAWGYIISNFIAVAFSAIYVATYLGVGFEALSGLQIPLALASILFCVILNLRKITDAGKFNNILVGLYNFLYLVQGHIEACGRIGVREYNSPIFPFIIQRPDSHIFVQCRRLIGNPVLIRPNLVKGISDVRKQHLLLGVKKGQEGHGYNIVRSNAHKHLVLPHPVIFCQGRYKLCGRRVWILAQTVRVHFP